jgi:hypothetical protein
LAGQARWFVCVKRGSAKDRSVQPPSGSVGGIAIQGPPSDNVRPGTVLSSRPERAGCCIDRLRMLSRQSNQSRQDARNDRRFTRFTEEGEVLYIHSEKSLVRATLSIPKRNGNNYLSSQILA